MTPRANLNISLTTELSEFVTGEVQSGRFRSASEVVRAGLRTLQQSSSSTRLAADEVAKSDAGVMTLSSPLELRYSAILESALEYAIIAFDMKDRVVEWNAGATAIMGWTAAEMLGSDGTMIFTPEDRAAGIPAQEMQRSDKDGRALNERWHMRADGGRFWGSGLMMPIRGHDGVPVGHLKIMQDCTEAHRLGRNLTDSEARLKAIFAAVPVGILVAEAPGGQLVTANEQMDRLFGSHWPRSAQISEYGAWECFHPDGRRLSPHEHPLARALYGEERPTLEALRRTDQDSRHWVRLIAAPIRHATGKILGAVLAVEDIDLAKQAEALLEKSNTSLAGQIQDAAGEIKDGQLALFGAQQARDDAEEQVRQLQKMEAVGQLTGGIAHDFNNMLAVVIGGISLMQRRLSRGDTNITKYIDAAMDGAQRAATLTQRLLAFSRQQALAPVALDANMMARGMEELLRRTLGEAIELEMVLAGGLWRTHADPSQLENALLNLAVNGRDAMNGSGRLTIETANCHLDESYARQHDEVKAGQYVLLAVSDIGSGMTPEVIARAFEPFFTTKEVGVGTGLGLSQVFGFVKQSGGHLKIYSEPGQGTTVKLYLPRFIGRQETVPLLAARPELLPGRPEEIILVVEDEQSVRELAVAALRDLGYSVVHANGSTAALQQLESLPEVTLLFTDIVLPGMNGRKLADEILKQRPGMKVLFTTGYTRNAVVHNAMLDVGVDLLGKPYSLQQLATKIRDMLDRASGNDAVQAAKATV